MTVTYKTCVSVAQRKPDVMIHNIKKALQTSEYAEARLDFLEPADIQQVLDASKKVHKRMIFTLRPNTPNDGGVFSGSKKQRYQILNMIIQEYKPFMLDIEWSTIKNNQKLAHQIKKFDNNLLVSWHNFEKTPGINRLYTLLRKMYTYSSNVKVACMATNTRDAIRMLELYRLVPQIQKEYKERLRLISFAMGEQGMFTRIVAMHMNSPFMYVSLGKKAVAPGQFSLDDIKQLN